MLHVKSGVGEENIREYKFWQNKCKDNKASEKALRNRLPELYKHI